MVLVTSHSVFNRSILIDNVSLIFCYDVFHAYIFIIFVNDVKHAFTANVNYHAMLHDVKQLAHLNLMFIL